MPTARGDVPVVTILADFEDDSIAASVGDVVNILRTDCSTRRQVIPARGQFALTVELGATAVNASVACDLRFREPLRLAQADRIGAYYWLKDAEFQLAFRLRDARGQIFETEVQTIRTLNRWVYAAAELSGDRLRRVRGDGPLAWPIEVQGCRVATHRLGRQAVYLDDFQVEHRVERRDMLRGELSFDQPTHIYPPGTTASARLRLENRSRTEGLRLSVSLDWTRPDGSVLTAEHGLVPLPASGLDFRARQPIDFAQRLDAPGVYQLAARVRAGDWTAPTLLTSAVVVTPSNRRLLRGRSTLLGLRTDLLREPPADQRLEIEIARDIGVHLLALDTPWEMLEPAEGRFDFGALDRLIDALVHREKDIAPLLVLTDPPDWATPGPERLTRLATLLTRLAARYGEKILQYQPEADTLGQSEYPALIAALRQLHDAVRAVRSDIDILSPALPVETASALPELADPAGPDWLFRTAGDAGAALQALERFRARHELAWGTGHWWHHEARPLSGATCSADAEAVLRYYVHAARAGVAGAIWRDLRDRGNDPTHPETMRGLVRRDFSPKTSLLGYATAAGMLTGLTCRGPVPGAPPEFESALFIGSDRQVAALLPLPNRVLPAVLAPIQGVPGEFEVRDFERSAAGLLNPTGPALVPSRPHPLFIILNMQSPQPEAQLGLATPWLRVPATVFCSADEPFALELDAPADVPRGNLRLVLPADAPFTAAPMRSSFTARAGETIQLPIRLTAKPARTFDRSSLTLRFMLDGDSLDLPLAVRHLVEIRPLTNGSAAAGDAEFRLGALAAGAEQRASASGTVSAAYEPERLHLAIALSDDRVVPATIVGDSAVSGDNLLVGVALAGADTHTEARVDISGQTEAATVTDANGGAKLSGWECALRPGGKSEERIYAVTISAGALGVARLEPPARLLLAVHYLDDDADGLAPVGLVWGEGLNGRRSGEGYRWARLGRGKTR